MDNIRLSDYLTIEEEKLAQLKQKTEKRARSLKWRTLFFVICFLLIVGGAIILSPMIEEHAHEKFMSLKDTDADQIVLIADDESLISDKTLFKKYERACLGNSCNNHLNGGLIADNIYGHSTLNKKGEAKIVANAGTFVLPEKADCINLNDNCVYYRSKDDHKFYSVDYSGKQKTLVIDTECAMCLVYMNRYIYYIDYALSGSLNRFDLESGNTKKIVNQGVKGFLILGDKYLYLDESNILRKCDSDGIVMNQIDNVDKFYSNGELIVQNNDRIVKVDLNEGKATELTAGVSELLGVDENNVYYNENKTMIARSLKDGSCKTLSKKYDYYYGAFCSNGKVKLVGGELNENK